VVNISGIIKSIQNIMRQDKGLNGDAQRIEQLGWMIFLKIFDDKDIEMELLSDDYVSPIPEHLQWRNWATDDEGMTGDELLDFINNKLFAELKTLPSAATSKRALLVKEVFEGNNNYMKSGTLLRQVINKLNEIDFNSSEDKHLFGEIYETILKELQSAGNSGEFYTPRAITQFITDMVAPKLGEVVFDPACGTGGFLTSAIEHIRANEVKSVEDRAILQNTIKGCELKPLPHMLALTNLILHDIEVPNIVYDDALSKELTSITQKDRVDVILANPPFGGTVADGMETNFPSNYRTKESADLFLILMIQYLKNNGRAGIVLPDGSLTGDGVKARIREKLLTDCNLHTIVRLPNSVFQPYASVATNLLFFTKGEPTKEVWYYEHRLPEGQKAYSKTKPIKISEFDTLKEWWNNREENEQAWKVDIKTIKDNGYNLDIKNPHKKEEEELHSSVELLNMLYNSFVKSEKLLEQLKRELANG
jgi:type I restriction enzyme M protein